MRTKAIPVVKISAFGSYGPGDNYQITLARKDETYALKGKIIPSGLFGGGNIRISTRTVKVTPEWAKALLAELSSARIPLMPPSQYGCDGTFYSLCFGDGYGGATYNWWSVPPEGWEVLDKVTEEIIKEFLKFLPD